MAFFKARVDGRLYEIDKLTLGDTRMLKHQFGLTDLEAFSSTDPDVIVGLLTIAIRKADPSKSIEAATTEAEGLDFESFETADDEKVGGDAGPLAVVGDSAATVAPSDSGSSETTPPTPGLPS